MAAGHLPLELQTQNGLRRWPEVCVLEQRPAIPPALEASALALEGAIGERTSGVSAAVDPPAGARPITPCPRPLPARAVAPRTPKAALKSLARLLASAAVLPLVLATRLLRPLIGRAEAFQLGVQAVALLPGLPGDYLREAYCRATLARFGRDARVSFGVLLSTPDAEIGAGAYVGPYCTLGLVSIGADTLLGSRVDVPSGPRVHGFDDPDVPIREQSGEPVMVRIGGDVWIGNGAVVLAGVGEGAVVGAGSVVTRPVPPGAIAVGNPAREVGRRGEDRREEARP